MRKIVLALALLGIVSGPAAADVLNFAGFAGITFTGNTSGASFFMGTSPFLGRDVGFLTDATNPTGLQGLPGAIAGTYEYFASDIITDGTEQWAPVYPKYGPYSFTLWDGWSTSSLALTGDVAWVEISTSGGAGGYLNNSGRINLTNLSYGGTNEALRRMAASDGALVVTFQFTPAKSLTQLLVGTNQTSYSGSVTAVPDGGMTVMLLGGALVGLEALRRMLRA